MCFVDFERIGDHLDQVLWKFSDGRAGALRCRFENKRLLGDGLRQRAVRRWQPVCDPAAPVAQAVERYALPFRLRVIEKCRVEAKPLARIGRLAVKPVERVASQQRYARVGCDDQALRGGHWGGSRPELTFECTQHGERDCDHGPKQRGRDRG